MLLVGVGRGGCRRGAAQGEGEEGGGKGDHPETRGLSGLENGKRVWNLDDPEKHKIKANFVG